MIIRDKWCNDIGLVPTEKDTQGRLQYDGHELENATKKACQRVIQRMHQNEVISKKFKRSPPVFIHDAAGIMDEQEIVRANPCFGGLYGGFYKLMEQA